MRKTDKYLNNKIEVPSVMKLQIKCWDTFGMRSVAVIYLDGMALGDKKKKLFSSSKFNAQTYKYSNTIKDSPVFSILEAFNKFVGDSLMCCYTSRQLLMLRLKFPVVNQGWKVTVWKKPEDAILIVKLENS